MSTKDKEVLGTEGQKREWDINEASALAAPERQKDGAQKAAFSKEECEPAVARRN
ncbi:hypothetical protein [Enterococcus sp. LJL51]|uniref:hypothetical protein n=1 Tax=Enterococcus sp. LJL51 TaxID=3416656 RepID=UPI003CF3EAB3